jgi:uncharacterized membrane protein YeaQ/YmgE (transglycosylase-associated protein family)
LTIALVVSWLVFGLVVGLLARVLYPGPQSMGLFATALLGIVGSFVGGALGNFVVGVDILTPHPAGIVASIIGALLVLALLSLQRGTASA